MISIRCGMPYDCIWQFSEDCPYECCRSLFFSKFNQYIFDIAILYTVLGCFLVWFNQYILALVWILFLFTQFDIYSWLFFVCLLNTTCMGKANRWGGSSSSIKCISVTDNLIDCMFGCPSLLEMCLSVKRSSQLSTI